MSMNDLNLDDNKRRRTVLRLTELKKLFGLMKCSARRVKTSVVVKKLVLNNYVFKSQHDAQETLSDLLETCFPYYDHTMIIRYSEFNLNKSCIAKRAAVVVD